ncbi:putative disease resistance protein RGA1 isoform X2 [Alnus glutinosa]|uniref:putative disease resistance protein RGA1 isoform X2 n=1 Tax=Alnus glutinosa TaxID=3517 RepID=UPI002D7A0E5D|nr:putative disease resistance protein RGA1 isoform X2 [Alnus glutinosa]
MVEAVLFDTAASIITSSASLALQEIGLLWGFKDELKKLGNTVSTIQAVLLDAEERQAHNHVVKDWLGKLKDAMYEADDLLDDYSTELLRRQVMTQDKKAKRVRIFFSKSNRLAYGFKMGHRIKALWKRLDNIATDQIKFGFNERPIGTQFEHRKRVDTHSFERAKEVIGREDDINAIKELLLDSDVKENVSIIPIVGIGGLGKTTLAQYVYNDEEVQKHFELSVWVCVSDPFDVKAIVQKIVECSTERRPESLEMDLLQRQLRAKIDGKRYLLVLDDVWNENRGTWLDLEKLLSGGLKGSKVLITTRSKRVAEITGTVPSYLLEGLSESNSWDLFKRMAFKDGEEPNNPKLVEIGREIIEKCAQVPLAIRSIGSLLYLKYSEADWLYFKSNELYKITQDDNSIFPILKLSYDHLSPQLKQCFAFCSLFPKDHEIEVEVLIQLWTAQGFIHWSDRTRCLEDVGREYFMDLLWRSFFQDIQRDEYGDIKRCKMHDLIHDLAQSVAGYECIISNPNAEKVVERNIHVAFDSLDSLRDIPPPLLKAHKMRSLFLHIPSLPSWTTLQGNKSTYDTLISSFKCLRALNFSCLNIQEVPDSIGKLKHLRYLDLSWNGDIELLPASITKLLNLQTLRLNCCSGLKELPEDLKNLISLRHLDLSQCNRIELLPASITKLQNLQTLRLWYCLGLKELPEDITNLISLRHLDLKECRSLTHMPHGLGKLTALQTLSQYTLGKEGSRIPKRKGGLADLESLDELRGELDIIGLKHLRSSPLEAKAANLERKQNLRTLILEWAGPNFDYHDSDKAIENDEQLLQNLQPHFNLKKLIINGYGGLRLSGWVSSLSNLVDIKIFNCKWCQHIPPLDRLPSLKNLILQNLSALEYISNDGSDVSSLSLESLELKDLPKLRGLWRMREAATTEHEPHHHLPSFPSFPCLSDLIIKKCPMLSLMPVVAQGSETAHSSSSPFSDLSKLKFLSLKGLEQLESLPVEWLQNLTSLESLDIRKCCKLRIFMSPLFQHLSALEDLRICKCRELISHENEEGTQWVGPTILRRLSIEKVPNLVSLPRELRHVTTLQELYIMDCPALNSLPEWIGDLTSLDELLIWWCPNLISLPEGMRRLTSLRRLIIRNCPRLQKRCERGTGGDWPKIAHVSYYTDRDSNFYLSSEED